MNKEQALKQIEELKKYIEDLDSAGGEIKKIYPGDVVTKGDGNLVIFQSEDEWTARYETSPFSDYGLCIFSKFGLLQELNKFNYKIIGRAKVVVEKI